jgi:dTMP kinase
MIQPQLICITGIDGSGKSTLVTALSKKIGSVHVANIWDAMLNISTIPFNSPKDIDIYLCELSPASRVLFLSHALRFALDVAERSGKEMILFNSYYYKYFATELALGADKELVKQLRDTFREPSLVFFLDADLSLASKRKERYSRYECGLTDDPSSEKFVSFQEKALREWKFFDMARFVKLDAKQDPDQLADHIIRKLVVL